MTNYQYNALGQRVLKQSSMNNETYLYGLQGELLGRYPANGDVSNNKLRDYIYFYNQLITVIDDDLLIAPVIGDDGDNVLAGGTGDDIIDAGAGGEDLLMGGAGSDTYILPFIDDGVDYTITIDSAGNEEGNSDVVRIDLTTAPTPQTILNYLLNGYMQRIGNDLVFAADKVFNVNTQTDDLSGDQLLVTGFFTAANTIEYIQDYATGEFITRGMIMRHLNPLPYLLNKDNGSLLYDVNGSSSLSFYGGTHYPYTPESDDVLVRFEIQLDDLGATLGSLQSNSSDPNYNFTDLGGGVYEAELGQFDSNAEDFLNNIVLVGNSATPDNHALLIKVTVSDGIYEEELYKHLYPSTFYAKAFANSDQDSTVYGVGSEKHYLLKLTDDRVIQVTWNNPAVVGQYRSGNQIVDARQLDTPLERANDSTLSSNDIVSLDDVRCAWAFNGDYANYCNNEENTFLAAGLNPNIFSFVDTTLNGNDDALRIMTTTAFTRLSWQRSTVFGWEIDLETGSDVSISDFLLGIRDNDRAWPDDGYLYHCLRIKNGEWYLDSKRFVDRSWPKKNLTYTSYKSLGLTVKPNTRYRLRFSGGNGDHRPTVDLMEYNVNLSGQPETYEVVASELALGGFKNHRLRLQNVTASGNAAAHVDVHSIRQIHYNGPAYEGLNTDVISIFGSLGGQGE